MKVPMNQLLLFERRDEGSLPTGQPVETWTVISKAWGSVTPISGREYFAASGERSDITHKIAIRWGGPAIVPSDRARLGERIFDIRSVLNDGERNRTATLMAVERIG